MHRSSTSTTAWFLGALTIGALACGGSTATPLPAPQSDGGAAEVVSADGVLGPHGPECRVALQCAMHGDGRRKGEACLASAPRQAKEAFGCIQQACPAGESLGPCIVAQCWEPFSTCWSGGRSGEATCGATWSCFGECGNDETCLTACLHAASPEAQRRFVEVEVCSDAFVANACAGKPSPECDQTGLASTCAAGLVACLEQGAKTPPRHSQTACDRRAQCAHWVGPKLPSATTVAPEGAAARCRIESARVHAGCPKADVAALSALEACLAASPCDAALPTNCAKQAASWSPSDLCVEILQLPVGP